MRTDCSAWISFTRGDSNSGLSLLTLGAEVSAALRHQNAADRGRASRTGLPFPAIDAVPELKAAAAAVGIDVIGHRGATGLDGFEQHLLNRTMQARGALACEPVGQRARMNAGAVQRLIGIDIAHAA